METLHQKVLPFILRRMKEDVLKDLPPKITQVSIADHLCPTLKTGFENFPQHNVIFQITGLLLRSKSYPTITLRRFLQI